MNPAVRAIAYVVICLAFLLSLAAQNEATVKPLPFRTAIELALKNSASGSAARADVQRAQATVRQARDVYLPQVTVGSALGYSHGFPLSLEGSAPSLFNVNIQEFVFNASQRDYIRAAQSDADTVAAQSADRRSDVILETALDYIQLDILDSSLSVQNEQQQAVARLQDIVNQRVQAGLDSQTELTRAKLAVAHTRLDIAQTESAADQLRLRLSQLTGLPANAIRTVSETIPQLPSVSQADDMAGEAAANNTSVKIAEEAAKAKEFRAQGERKTLYPTLDLAGQYAVLARFNNYDKFFQPGSFQRNNLSIGVLIRFPFLNPPLRAAATAARFDAVKAREEARNVKQQVSAEALRQQRSVQRFAAARDVAQLEHDLAQADIDAIHAKVESGGASLREEQNARVTEHQRYTAYLNSGFELDKAQVQLLRQIGELESWALGPTKR
jgi:outer membrane protein TolC